MNKSYVDLEYIAKFYFPITVLCNGYRLNGRAVSDCPECIEILTSIDFTGNSIYFIRMNQKGYRMCIYNSRRNLKPSVRRLFVSYIIC